MNRFYDSLSAILSQLELIHMPEYPEWFVKMRRAYLTVYPYKRPHRSGFNAKNYPAESSLQNYAFAQFLL